MGTPIMESRLSTMRANAEEFLLDPNFLDLQYGELPNWMKWQFKACIDESAKYSNSTHLQCTSIGAFPVFFWTLITSSMTSTTQFMLEQCPSGLQQIT